MTRITPYIDIGMLLFLPSMHFFAMWANPEADTNHRTIVIILSSSAIVISYLLASILFAIRGRTNKNDLV